MCVVRGIVVATSWWFSQSATCVKTAVTPSAKTESMEPRT